MADIRIKDLTEAAVPGGDYYLLTDSAADGPKKIKPSNIVTAADIGAATLAGVQTLTNKTISGSSNTLTNIPNSALTNPGITISGTSVALGGSKNLSPSDLGTVADSTILSNISGSLASASANTIASVIDKQLGATRGSIAYRGAAGWASVPPGVSGQYLKTLGPGTDPIFDTPAGGGDMLASIYAKRLYDYDTVAVATSAAIPAAQNVVRTGGRNSVGNGGAQYKRVGSSPSHAGKFQSADGAWWEIAEPIIDARMLGLAVGSPMDAPMAAAIGVAAALGCPLYIPAGTFQFTSEVNFSSMLSSVAKIILGGVVMFDFSSASSTAGFPNNSFVVIDAGALVSIGSLGADFSKASRAISISSPSLSPQTGDVLCVYNSADGSYNAAKASYRAGELIRTASYSAGVVIIAGSLLDSYPAATTTVYKHPAKKVRITGGTIFIKESTASVFDAFESLTVTRVADSDLSAFFPMTPAHSGMMLNQCVGLYGVGYHVEQNRRVGPDNYGMVISNCQDVMIDGNFTAVKHPVTVGGQDAVGAIVNSNIYVSGTFRNLGPASPGVGYAAVNCHGNVRFCYYKGLIDGGVSMGGNHNGVLPGSTIWARGDSYGTAVLLVDMVGHDFRFKGLEIFADGDPSVNSAATIDIGQAGYGPNSNTKAGGTIDFSDTFISCPASLRPFSYTNRGYTGSEQVNISFRGAKFKESSAASPAFIIQTVSGRNIDVLDVAGLDSVVNLAYSVAGVTKVRGWSAGGTFAATPVVGNAVATQHKTFNAPRVPAVIVTPGGLAAGGKAVRGYYASAATTGVDVGVSTYDNSAFTTTDGAVGNWFASVNE